MHFITRRYDNAMDNAFHLHPDSVGSWAWNGQVRSNQNTSPPSAVLASAPLLVSR